MRVQFRRPVPLSVHGRRRLHYRSDVADVAPEIAERLVSDGRAIPVGAEPGAVPVFDDLSVPELQALADERGLTVEGTGSGGKVLKGDLISALTVA